MSHVSWLLQQLLIWGNTDLLHLCFEHFSLALYTLNQNSYVTFIQGECVQLCHSYGIVPLLLSRDHAAVIVGCHATITISLVAQILLFFFSCDLNYIAKS